MLILKRFVTACFAVGQRFVLELCAGLSEVMLQQDGPQHGEALCVKILKLVVRKYLLTFILKTL